MSPLAFARFVSPLGRGLAAICMALCLSAGLLQASSADAAAKEAPLRLAQDDVGQPTYTLPTLRQNQLQILQTPAQRSVEVPDLRGMTVPEAEAMASRLGLKLGANEFQETSAPRFRISRQSPKAGNRALLGSWITVDTEAWTQVPRLTGRAPQDAKRLAERARLVAEVARTVEADVAQATVQSQKPKPGTWVRERSQVALIVARPPALVEVPNVIGRDPASAQRLILAAGLVPMPRQTTTGDVQQSVVARQAPTGGASAKPGSVVQIQVVQPAAAPPSETQPQRPETVTVPNLIGLAPDEAEARLRRAGLQLSQGRLLDGAAGAGEHVVAQRPGPETSVEPGSRVVVDIEVPPPMGAVPNIVGLTLQDAIVTVTRGGFSFESQGAGQVDARRAEVIAQEPAADTMAPFGSKVTARVQPILVTVPEIVGQTVAAARTRIETAGLRFGPRGLQPLEPEGQTIATQEPAAGAQVPPGTLVVARPAPPLPPQRPQVVVPDLQALSVSDAANKVAAAGLRLGTQEADLATRDAIERQDPAAGTEVAQGSLVRVWLAAATTRVPELAGLGRDEAERRLDDAGLELSTQEADMPTRDEIARQDPEAGREVALGSLVRVWLAAATTRVPNLAGLDRDEAERRLDDAGLRLADPPAGETREPDAVVSQQRPAAGSEVPLQTRVTVALQAPATEPSTTNDVPQVEPPDSPRQIPSTNPSDADAAAEQSHPEILLTLTARDLLWAAGGAGAMLLLLVAAMLLRPRARRSGAPAKPASLSFKTARDPGTQTIAWDAEPALRCRLTLRTIRDAGTQSLLPAEGFTPEPVRRYG